MAAWRTRSSCDASKVAAITITPEASVNMNRNSIAALTWSSTSRSLSIMAPTLKIIRLGNSPDRRVMNCLSDDGTNSEVP